MNRTGFGRKVKTVSCATRRKPVLEKKSFFSSQMTKSIFSFVMVLVIVGGVFVVKRKKILDQVNLSKVGRISVEGNASISRSELLSILGIKNGDALTREKINAAKKKILEHPRVSQVSISSNLRGQVKVLVRERLPIALLNTGTRTILLDNEGKNLGPATAAENTAQFFNVTGPWSEKNLDQLVVRFAEVMAIRAAFLSYPQLGQFLQVNFDPEEGWSVQTSGLSFPIIVGQSIDSEKMKRLRRVLANLGEEISEVIKIDLDFKDRVVVKMKEAA